MYLHSISLRQFRSYRDFHLSVAPGVNLFLGLNGSGKTNLLEAIHTLGTGLSFRGCDVESMVSWGERGFYLGGHFKPDGNGENPIKLEMKYQRGSSRTIQRDGKMVVRLRDLLGLIPVVSFAPEDLSLVKGEPVLRRRALNMILAQVDSSYAAELRKYSDVLKSRNAALRQITSESLSWDALDPWDEGLVKSGILLTQARCAFLSRFSKLANRVHQAMSGNTEELTVSYRPSVPMDGGTPSEMEWREKISSIRAQEATLGATLTGPHRDDVLFCVNGREARIFGSEGQKRTAAIAFKLAEVPFIRDQKGQNPICLLDDILSELDVRRAAHLLDELARTGQCFVTLTGLESWPKDHELPASIFSVENSRVRSRTELFSRPQEGVASLN